MRSSTRSGRRTESVRETRVSSGRRWYIPTARGGCDSRSVRELRQRSKLPRPTRSLSCYGDRSLLEGGAVPQRHCAPRPRSWGRPGFLLPSCRRRGDIDDASRFERRRGSSRRFSSRCSHALPQNRDGVEPFAVVVPAYRARYSRTTGASSRRPPWLRARCGESTWVSSSDIAGCYPNGRQAHRRPDHRRDRPPWLHPEQSE
jgi:hypothetical protein